MAAHQFQARRHADRHRLAKLQLAARAERQTITGLQQGLRRRLTIHLSAALRLEQVALAVARQGGVQP